MSQLSIRGRLLLLTLVPPLVLLFVILSHFAYQDSRLMQDALLDQGKTLSRYLASAAEYSVVTGNTEQLRHIGDSVMQGDVSAFHVYDMDGRVVFSLGEITRQRNPLVDATHSGVCGGDDNYLLFCAPIQLAALPVSDYEHSSALPATLLGHVELTLSTQRVSRQRLAMLGWTIMLTIAVMIAAYWLSRRMERQLARPLSNLSKTVGEVRRGNLDVQSEETGSGEVLQLQQGVNAMVDALANYRQHMESEVASATECLRTTLQELEKKNSELQVQQQRAQSASLAKSQFLATMSHEIRTPLGGMIGMLQLLRDGSESRRQLDYLDSLESAALSLRQLIDDILDFSRLEVGKLAIQNRVFNPLQIIEEVMVMLAPSAHHKGIEFVLAIKGRLPREIEGDPLRFRQVLINLTANAIKFTDHGEVAVSVRVRGSEEGDGTCALHFAIQDSGIGIPREKQALVFESFTQLDDGDARNFGGSGLGATVSRELVEMMGGEIGLQSEVGVGSCFWFTLPCKVVSGPTTVDIGGKALLLERHTVAAQAMAGLLEAQGVEVCRVADESALDEALAQQHFDWLFIGEHGTGGGEARLLERLGAKLAQESRLCLLQYVTGATALSGRVDHLHKPLLPSMLHRYLAAEIEGEQERPAALTGRPLSVLLAEDDAINAKVITHFLEQGGHTVSRVTNGESALEKMRQSLYDCVLMDIRMPGLDGLEATRRWRSTEKGRRLPIIALTANASEEDRQRSLEAGMDAYLTKPVNRGELLDMLEQHCA